MNRFCILILLLAPLLLQAQAGSGGARVEVTSLEEAVELVLQENPELLQLREKAEVHRRNLPFAALPSNPQLGIEIEGVDPETGFDEGELSMMIAQEFETGLTLVHRKKIAQLELQQLELEIEMLERSLERDISTLYLEREIRLLALNSAQRIAKQNNELRLTVQRKVEAGLLLELDSLQADLNYKSHLLEISSMENELKGLEAELALMLGLATDKLSFAAKGGFSSLNPDEGVREDFEPDSAGALVEALKIDTLFLAGSRLERSKSERAKKLEIAAAIPDIEVGLGMNWSPAEERPGFAAEFSIPLPVFDQNIPALREADYLIRAAAAAEQREQLELESQLAALKRDFLQALESYVSLKDDLLPAARMALEMESGWYLNGKSQISRLLSAVSELEEARLSTFDALSRLTGLALDMRFLTGEFPEGLHPGVAGLVDPIQSELTDGGVKNEEE